jgi:hypothetical protein
MVRDEASRVGVRPAAVNFPCKSPTLSSDVGFGIVYMNNKLSPIDLRVERKQCRENIITVILGIESLAFRKRGK